MALLLVHRYHIKKYCSNFEPYYSKVYYTVYITVFTTLC